jgi:anaerobic ribonucleoside-triphosphate reductase activating protein
MSDADLVVARVVARTRAEGPGERTAVWVQGCSIRCPGCFNPHLWGFRGGTVRTPQEIIDAVVAAGTEGITLLGGEPFDQAAPLASVAAGIQAAGLSVMTFTGYTMAQLTTGARRDAAALLDHTDLLAAGPFVGGQIDTGRPWVGSTNQEFVPLTLVGADMMRRLPGTPDRLEVVVDTTGRAAVNGWAELDALDQLLGTAMLPRPPRSR